MALDPANIIHCFLKLEKRRYASFHDFITDIGIANSEMSGYQVIKILIPLRNHWEAFNDFEMKNYLESE